MERLSPGIQIVGTFAPPFRPLNEKEENELIRQISNGKPDIIWIGLSTPKQELFMNDTIEKLKTKLMFGVGAAFDFHSGRGKQAPKWMQHGGLEWFYRLLADPKRLWKRYFKIIPLFIVLLILQYLRIKKYSTKSKLGKDVL